MDAQIEVQEAVFAGYAFGKNNLSLTDIVQKINLTIPEWDILRVRVPLSRNEKHIIDKFLMNNGK